MSTATAAALAESTGTRIVRLGVGVVVMLVAVVGALIAEGGHLASVIQTTSFGLALSGPLLALFAAGFSAPEAPVARASFLGLRYAMMAQAAVYASVIGNVMGFVMVMQNLDKPDNIGPGIAIAFVVTVHAALGWAVLRAMGQSAAVAAIGSDKPVPSAERDLQAMLAALFAIMMLMFAVFVVLRAIKI